MKNSGIEWTHHTFNPWIGCTKVSPACDNCYAENSMPAKFQKITWGAGQERKRTSDANWREPLRWNADCAKRGVRERVFCASLADVFDNAVPAEWRSDLLALIYATPYLDWLLLTKRIGNAMEMLDDAARTGLGPTVLGWANNPLKSGAILNNVWLGATICNQEEANRDIPKLLATPADKRFLSIEPMLWSIDLTNVEMPESGHGHHEFEPIITGNSLKRADPSKPKIDWVICGGESGPNARPMHPDWARSLRDQCQAAGTAFFFKQWGEWCPRGPESLGYPCVDGVPRVRLTDANHNGQDLSSFGGNDVWMNRAGKKSTGRLLDGREWNEVPA